MSEELRSLIRWPIATSIRRWACAGVVAGLIVPWILILICERHSVPPLAFFVFWPTVLFLLLEGVPRSALLLLLLVFGANGLIYGAITSALRRYSFLVPALLLVVVPLSLPPSAKQIAHGFPTHQTSLERLVQLMEEDRDVAKLTSVSLTTLDGKSYSTSDPNAPLSPARLGGYRSLFRQAGIAELVREKRSYVMVVHRFDVPERIRTLFETDESIQLHTFADGLATYSAYVFCPVEAADASDYICDERNRDREYKSFRCYRLNPNWFYLTVFRKNGPD